MRKTIKVFREEWSKDSLFVKLVDELNKDNARQVIILSQEYTKIFAMYKTNNWSVLDTIKKVDAEKQNELLEESVSDEVLQNNGADHDQSNDKEDSEKDSKKVI